MARTLIVKNDTGEVSVNRKSGAIALALAVKLFGAMLHDYPEWPSKVWLARLKLT